MIREQHDHHCVLTFEGFNWRIGACARDRVMVYRSTRYPETVGRWVVATINTQNVDWNAYCEAAATWDMRRSA